MGKVGNGGHDTAGGNVGGVEQERGAGAQHGAAIIAGGQKSLRLRRISFFLKVMIKRAAKPARHRQQQQSDENAHQPDPEPAFIRFKTIVTISHGRENGRATGESKSRNSESRNAAGSRGRAG